MHPSRITDRMNFLLILEKAFPLWAKAIVLYCKNSQQTKMLKAETVDYSDDIDDGMCV